MVVDGIDGEDGRMVGWCCVDGGGGVVEVMRCLERVSLIAEWLTSHRRYSLRTMRSIAYGS